MRRLLALFLGLPVDSRTVDGYTRLEHLIDAWGQLHLYGLQVGQTKKPQLPKPLLKPPAGARDRATANQPPRKPAGPDGRVPASFDVEQAKRVFGAIARAS